MGFREVVGGGVGFYFFGVGSLLGVVNGRIEWERRFFFCRFFFFVVNFGKVEDLGCVSEWF